MKWNNRRANMRLWPFRIGWKASVAVLLPYVFVYARWSRIVAGATDVTPLVWHVECLKRNQTARHSRTALKITIVAVKRDIQTARHSSTALKISQGEATVTVKRDISGGVCRPRFGAVCRSA
jgi:hypothetical protein